jgi:DNA repair photolyase
MVSEYEEMSCSRVLDSYGIFDTRGWTRHCFDPYVNCEFNCVYCNSGIQRREESRDVTVPVYVKMNGPKVLDRELGMLKRRGVVSMGVATDIYQQAEEKYKVTRQVLEVLKKHKVPFSLGTKSDLILRDLDVICEAAEKSWCHISLSIGTLDEKLAKQLEPNAPSPKRRLEAVRRLSEEGIMVGIWLCPILPYVSDTEESLAKVIEAAVDNGARFVLGGSLDMRNPDLFERFLKKNFPKLIPKYKKLYDWTDKPPKWYPNEFYLYGWFTKFIDMCQKRRVESYIPHFHTRKQAWLFYLRNFGKFEGAPVFETTQLLNYLSPSKEILQIINLKSRKRALGKGLLKTLRYYPH